MDLATLLQGNNLLLMGATVAITTTVRTMFPAFFTKHWGERLLPLLPLLIGIIGALIGVSEGDTVSEKIAIGLLAGFTGGQLFKIGRTTFMGYGVVPRGTPDEATKEVTTSPSDPNATTLPEAPKE